MNLNPTVRWLLGGAAAVVGYLAASDPFGLPPAVQGGIAVLSVLFAALGITPPQAQTRDGQSVDQAGVGKPTLTAGD